MALFRIGIPVTAMLACGWVFTVLNLKLKNCKSLFYSSIILVKYPFQKFSQVGILNYHLYLLYFLFSFC